MKKNSVLLLLVFFIAQCMVLAQGKKPALAHPAAQPVLKSTIDSLSYAIGISVAGFYKEQGVNNVNVNLVSKAINDALKNGKPLLNDQQCNSVILAYVQKTRSEKASVAKKEGETFLTENKKKPGVVTLPSGLQYQVLKQGDGPKPTITDTVRCHYHGTLLDGTIFDSSVDRGQPMEFPLTGVISGWTEALMLMPVGSKWKLFIPSSLAYGDQANGRIKAGSVLLFDLELLGIVHNH